MQRNAFLLALTAGFISAIVFASATTGPVALRFVLYVLTPLSLYLAGLGLGAVAAAIAGIFGASLILLLANPVVAFAYGLSTALPAYVVTHLLLLRRTTDHGNEWYPPGRVITVAALFGGMFTLLILLLMGGDAAALAKTMRELVESFVKAEVPTLPGGEALTQVQIEDIARKTLATLPFALGAVAMGTILFNTWFAARITHASGRLMRPWPDLRMVDLPAGTSLALLIATALTFVPDTPGLMATGFAGALTLAFALIGLATIHVYVAASPWKPFVLWTLYLAAVFLTAPALLVLALGGLAETVFRYRQNNPPPPRPPPTAAAG